MRVLVADDDPQILKALRIILTAHGYDVSLARDGREAIDVAAHDRPDVIVLDLGMPGLDGVAVIEAVRGWATTPILVVSGRTDTSGKVDALDAGADDYVTKPFATEELLARLRALTRRVSETADAPTVAFGDVVVDLAARRVTRAGAEVRLTPTEWAVLEQLVRNPRRLVTQQTLLTSVWGPTHTRDSGYLRIYLGTLRKKLEPEPSRPRHLITEPGIGYRFVPDPD
ncbi:response regulator [Amnibacterium soli]|uniref:response regulator n=1 Tax=Amnibacterium soli TaxID=1282736 RepID=UPI0031E7C9F6